MTVLPVARRNSSIESLYSYVPCELGRSSGAGRASWQKMLPGTKNGSSPIGLQRKVGEWLPVNRFLFPVSDQRFLEETIFADKSPGHFWTQTASGRISPAAKK